ncbi:MAG: hypothetical protein J6J01_00585 [Oscillospiraceae bacterium]|nr:hypothetical protein [Oscillospiraceae bacterium]
MRKIEILTDKISEELDDACSYIKLAHEYKDKDVELATLFYRLSNEEMTHMDLLHKRVVETIMSYKREHGEPPAAMEAVYNHLHKKHIEKAEKIVNMQNMYKR